MATFLVCHGARSGGWAWRQIRAALAARGHEVFTPTGTGLGERAHLAHPLVDLETHIRDVPGVIACAALRDVVLVGHGYGGMVATGAADRSPKGTVCHLVHVDAVVPEDGRSLASHTGGEARFAGAVAGWLLPPGAHRRTAMAAHPQSTAPARSRGRMPSTNSPRRSGAIRARRFHAMDASHSPNITAPEALEALLLEAA